MRLTIPAFSDYHVHLRQGPKAVNYLKQSARSCSRVMAMPNTHPPVCDPVSFSWYAGQFAQARKEVDIDLLFAAKMTPQTTLGIVDVMANYERQVAWKLYPAGVTTHSDDGIPVDWLVSPHTNQNFCDVIERIQHHGKVLCLHGEMPNQEDPLLREVSFLWFAGWLHRTFPKLKIVLEHITTAESVEFVKSCGDGRLAATITPHHLMFHLGHLLGSATQDSWGYGDGKIHPHLFCWPCLKQPRHRNALFDAAASGDSRFFLGSDSAPHLKHAKEASCGCAGVYNSPVLAPIMFEELHCNLDVLVNFTSRSGDRFYGVENRQREITISDTPFTVPDEIDGVVPFLAGRTLPWSLEE